MDELKLAHEAITKTWKLIKKYYEAPVHSDQEWEQLIEDITKYGDDFKEAPEKVIKLYVKLANAFVMVKQWEDKECQS